MAYTANELISNAFYLSNIVSRDFEQPTGAQITTGLSILNDLLADKTANSSMIPYSSNYTFNAVQGTSEYFVPDLIYADTFTFFIDSVRYQTRNEGRDKFFGSSRATNVESLPFSWHGERTLGGTNIYLYFTPDTTYPCEIWGTFALSSVTQFQDLELTLDRFYINFLKYELADRLCTEYGFTTPDKVRMQMESYYRWINSSTNTKDLGLKKISAFSGDTGVNYAYANLGNGFVPWRGN